MARALIRKSESHGTVNTATCTTWFGTPAVAPQSRQMPSTRAETFQRSLPVARAPRKSPPVSRVGRADALYGSDNATQACLAATGAEVVAAAD